MIIYIKILEYILIDFVVVITSSKRNVLGLMFLGNKKKLNVYTYFTAKKHNI